VVRAEVARPNERARNRQYQTPRRRGPPGEGGAEYAAWADLAGRGSPL